MDNCRDSFDCISDPGNRQAFEEMKDLALLQRYVHSTTMTFRADSVLVRIPELLHR